MRFLSNLFAVLLIVIIVGGLGYVGYTYYTGGSAGKPADQAKMNPVAMNASAKAGSNTAQASEPSKPDATDQSGQSAELSPEAELDPSAVVSATAETGDASQTAQTDQTMQMGQAGETSQAMQMGQTSQSGHPMQTGQNGQAGQTMQTNQSEQVGQAMQMGQSEQAGQAMQMGQAGSMTSAGFTQVQSNQLAVLQINTLLQNKAQLEQAIDSFNDAQKTMTVDPYAPTTNTLDNASGSSMNMGGTAPTSNPGNSNTTINIYPQAGQTGQATAMSTAMGNMGVTYDANKMEQIHNGLYKVSVGMVLLGQLQKDLVVQAENGNAGSKDPVQYLTNQFTLTVQDKTKLDQALIYLNNALSVADINPYISTNGLVYNKDRMNQVHQGIMKLAEGITGLNQLQSNLLNQMILLSDKAQEYADINLMAMNNMAPTNTSSRGLFGNISTNTIVRALEIIFIIGLVLGILGFVNSLLKGSQEKVTREVVDSEETA